MIIGELDNINVYEDKIELDVYSLDGSTEKITIFPGNEIACFCDPFFMENRSNGYVHRMSYDEFLSNLEKEEISQEDEIYGFIDDLRYIQGIGIS